MLLDEDPASLIANCITNFSTKPDRDCLKRTHAALADLHSQRASLLTSQRTTLASQNRTLANLQNNHAITTKSHNPITHSTEISRLDTAKFRIAKEAHELEIATERLAKEIGGAKRALSEDGEGVGGMAGREEEGADEMLLKLKVYRMLGIDVEADAETGLYNKAVVRSGKKGDVKVVNVDPRFSRYFYANYFWDAL
ncbi:kinetochore protein-like protein spc24 [Microthyrium microscopicum]|uniref:Kinetochore protein Spc24 n=1 Tax=Microthyrium microscopicum TaxID=703497 RepID=A0A6A6UCB9_9PEZI|nr:kinetochore protein-like protein spc24 [Microthyrium microscopicum]